jgi:hypothetical protein
MGGYKALKGNEAWDNICRGVTRPRVVSSVPLIKGTRESH